ncbi:MAG TPA: hydantoinase B/oxoprolinase family protein [Candidatus Binatia bacterium]|nr:hydantoinase B/oxoprolinase family protein [Candidatus Binatia bacterium]
MAVQSPPRIDPVTLEVLRNALPAIADEMSVDLQRTSYNMMIYEVRDYCCALLDVEGRLISQNIGGVSHFVADLGVVIKDGVERFGRDGFRPGDVIVTNHQRVAGQHLNNVCIYTPFFFEGELLAFGIVRAHWIDVGGLSTGFGAMSLVSDPWMEGLQLDQIKLYEGGVPDEKILRFIRDNIRYPESSMGDMRSQMAACKLAERRLEELFARYGRDTILTSIERIFDETEAKCRLVVREIPDGTYEAESYLDSDGADRDSIVPFKIRVIVKGDDMTIDLTECSLQRRGAINARTLAGPYIAYKGITGPLEPVNEGSFRALKVEIQEGNIMMARHPAPMAGWSRMLPTVVDTIIKALAPALPEKMPAAHMGTLGGALVFFGKDPRNGRDFVLQTIEGGGWGARPWEDGESASVSVCQGDVRNAPIETIELKTPVIVEKRALRENSGGPGKYRGGLGMMTQVRGLVEGRWSTSNSGRRKLPPWGLWNGKPGAASQNLLRLPGEEFKVADPVREMAPAGTSVAVCTAGGGGWGDPFERDPERVRFDVVEGFVSLESARDDYGVAIDPVRMTVDAAATKALRSKKGDAR